MQIRLKTITPLHIGNGDELHSLDYVVHQSKFYRVGQGQFLAFLKPFGKDAANRFTDWVMETTDTIENLKQEKEQERSNRQFQQGGRRRDYNQELSALHRQFNYLVFADMIGQKDAFLQYLKSNVKPLNIHAEELKQQVRGLMRTGDGKAYLPGTSLKGVIRTALLFHLLDNEHIHADTVRGILNKAMDQVNKDKRDARAKGNKFNVEKAKANFAGGLEEAAFYCEMKTEKGFLKTGEEQYDLMKLLLVSDAYPEHQTLGVDNVDLYLVNKTKDRRTNKMEIVADVQRQTPAVEVITEGGTFDCHIEFNIDFLLTVQPLLKDGSIKSKGAVHWIDIADKVKKLFNLDITTLTAKNKEEKRAAVLAHILDCVRRFSQRQIEHDKDWLKNFLENDRTGRFDSKINEGFTTTLARPKATLFNLGYASGFQGTTELLYFAEYCRPELKAVMELFGIGDKPGANKNRKPGETYNANIDKFPKSKRLITRRQEIKPLGWLVWENGNEAITAIAHSITNIGEPEKPKEIPAPPTAPLKQGLEVYAQIIQCGSPNKLKLLLSDTNQPTVDFRYGPGFPADKKDTWVVVRITGIQGRNKEQSVAFVRFV